jgi:hypothetical protein
MASDQAPNSPPQWLRTKIAALATVAPDTVTRWWRGEPTRSITKRRIVQALEQNPDIAKLVPEGLMTEGVSQ